MNVKINDQTITYKISEKELDWLLQNNELETGISVSKTVLSLSLVHTPDEAQAKLCFVPKDSGARLSLHMPRSELKKLLDMGKDRDGLSYKLGGVSVTIQVDVHQDKRRFAKPPKKRT